MKNAWAVALGAAALAIGPLGPIDAQQGAPSGVCRVSGKATSGTTPLPGVTVTVKSGDAVKGATSTDPDGSYHVNLPAGAYRLSADLTGFVQVERELSVSDSSCSQTIDLQLALAPRQSNAGAARGAAPAPAGANTTAGQSNQPVTAANGRGTAPGVNGTAAGRGQRFATLAVQTQAGAAAGLEVSPPDREGEAAALLLPPGFSTEGPTQAVSITGNMASLDRGMLNDRLEAIGRGEFDPVTGEFAQGFAPGQGGFGGGFGGPGGPGGFGGRGGPGGAGGPGGGRGRTGRSRGIRAWRPRRPAEHVLLHEQLHLRRIGARQRTLPAASRLTRDTDVRTRGTHSAAPLAGPVKIRHVYDGTRRTNFMVTYSGNHGANLFDQYAAVPTEAMRDGDFSAAGVTIVNPATGQPFAGNRIPAGLMSPTALALLPYIPAPNLTDTSRNFHYVTTTSSASDNVNLRVTHNFTPNVAGRGGRGGPGGGGGGRGFGGPGRGGRGVQQGTSVSMTAQVQYRRNDNDQTNVFPSLGGTTTGSSLAVPVTLNIVHKRILHNVSVNFSRTESSSFNRYAFVNDVTGDAGIAGVSTDPFDWGVPQLSFSSLSSLRDVTPSRRTDSRLTMGYGWTHPSHEAHAAGRRGRSSRQHEQPDGLEPEWRLRFHGPVLLGRRGPDSKRTGSTSPISCSVSRSRPRCSTGPARSSCAASRSACICRTTGARARG